MEKKREAVLTCYYRPKPGGLCKRLFKGINVLLNRGVDVHYLAAEEFPIYHKNIHYHRLYWPLSNKESLLFWAYLHLISPFYLVYIAVKYKVVRLFAFGSNYGYLLQLARLFTRKPLIVFLRADTIKNHRLKNSSKTIIYIDTFIEGLGIYGTYLYGVSKNTLDSVCSRHKHLLPKANGVLYNNIEQVLEKDIEINLYPLRLAVVGVLEERKNIGYLVNCVGKIRELDYVLQVFGDGPEKQNLMELVNKLELSKKVKFMGWVDEKYIWNNVDVLIIPSKHEGLSNALIEAIANGIPVIASNIPEHKEILDKNNLFDLNNCEYLHDKLKQIFNNPSVVMNEMKKSQVQSTRKLIFDWDDAFYSHIFQQ